MADVLQVPLAHNLSADVPAQPAVSIQPFGHLSVIAVPVCVVAYPPLHTGVHVCPEYLLRQSVQSIVSVVLPDFDVLKQRFAAHVIPELIDPSKSNVANEFVVGLAAAVLHDISFIWGTMMETVGYVAAELLFAFGVRPV